MYKIYINESILLLGKSSKKDKLINKENPDLVNVYQGNKKHLLNYIDMMEKNPTGRKVLLHSENYIQLKEDFRSLVVEIPAAGGLVVNEKKEILFIYRRKNWDLPKGKIDEGEKRKDAAIREVIEETGIKSVTIENKMGKTIHLFRTGKNLRAIKLSYWYLMSTHDQKLTPQIEEDIEEARWMTKADFLSLSRPVYPSIMHILDKYETSNE